MSDIISPQDFHNATTQLRRFFLDRNYLEVHTQNRLSILAACEDPRTIATFNYKGQVWPLPQTGQMWLEHELLTNPNLPGVFTMSTSYRLEPNPIPGRHNLIFPMFEFESKGDFDDLMTLERKLLEHLGFGPASDFASKDYSMAIDEFGVNTIEAEQEDRLCQQYGNAVLLHSFPYHTSPFWNMKYNADRKTAKKIDVIIHGMETIGSAERSCDRDTMRELFHSISDGQYAGLLFEKFGKERVIAELEEFLTFDFFPRFGGGIGMTRLINGLQKEAERRSSETSLFHRAA